MGVCLESVEVKPGDSRDKDNKYTFFSFDPDTHLSISGNSASPYWYWNNIYYPNKNVSTYVISNLIIQRGISCSRNSDLSYIYKTFLYLLFFRVCQIAAQIEQYRSIMYHQTKCVRWNTLYTISRQLWKRGMN